MVIKWQILQVSPVFRSLSEANFSRVQGVCTASNEENFISSIITLNDLIKKKVLNRSFLFIKVIFIQLFC